MFAKKFVFLLFSIGTPTWAFDVPAFTPNVVDTTGMIKESEFQLLNQKIMQIRGQSGIMAGVLIVPTLNGEAIENAAEKTFNAWQLGQAGLDNGLLILIALHDRQARIEVGYGLEGAIPDARTRQVIDNKIVPRFKEKEYLRGLVEALEALDEIVEKGDRFVVKPPSWYENPFAKQTGIWLFIIFLLPILFRVTAVIAGLRLSPELRPTASERSFRGLAIGPSFVTSLQLACVGPMFVLREQMRLPIPASLFVLVVVLVPMIFLFELNKGYFSMIFPRRRPQRIDFRSRVIGKFQLVDRSRTGDGPVPSGGQGTSSSSSRSSSSQGGRSGGGGSSGRW